MSVSGRMRLKKTTMMFLAAAFVVVLPGAALTEAFTVEEGKEAVLVDTGSMQVVFDKRLGTIRSLKTAGKTLINENEVPPLFATLLESEEYDGTRDYVPRRFLEATYQSEKMKINRTGDRFQVEGIGALLFPGGDRIRFRMNWEVEKGGTHIRQSVALDPEGDFTDRFVREIGLSQPFSMNFRKRVVQGGDQGLRWDTRYNYQFHQHVNFLEEPDRNWWRHFYVNQESSNSYTVWRSQAKDTAGLYPFRGRRAPGWMTVYDEEGGALFAYRNMYERAPKALYVNADDGSEARVLLHGSIHPAADLRGSCAADNIFGSSHEIDWIFFGGEEFLAKPDVKLAGVWGKKALSSCSPVNPQPLSDELELWTADPPPADFSLPVVGGIPLPRSAIKDASNVRLFVDGSETPLQTEILGYWPDHSIKWLLLIFPLDGDGGYHAMPGKGAGGKVDFDVTLRDGSAVSCKLIYGSEVRKGKVNTPLRINRRGELIEVNTGPLSVELGPGKRFLRSVSSGGRELLWDDGQPQAFVDYLQTDGNYPVGTTHPEGHFAPGPVYIEQIDLISEGPLRTVIRLAGYVLSDEIAGEKSRVIMWLEAYASRSSLRLLHTIEFMHNDPRRTFVQHMGLRLPLVLDRRTLSFFAGGQDGPMQLEPGRAAGLQQFSHLGYKAWQAFDGDRHRSIADENHRSRGWLAAADADGGLSVGLRSMWEMFPKELVYRADEGVFEIGLWPESSPLMDVRRYSNYPHRGQGESVPDGRPDWVEESYYSRDPFAGTSRSHELLLTFYGPDWTMDHIDGLIADFQSQPLVYAGWDWYMETGITIPQIGPGDSEFERSLDNMQNMANWWLFHRDFWGWYGMWEFGDVRHYFRSGYGRIFSPDDLREILAMSPEKRRERNIAREFRSIQDYYPPNDWAFDNGRWGWSSTEGLVNLFMSTQYLRSGDRDLYFFMESCARLSRDVVARHGGRWFGAGTRHGVQHWSCGNHEPRQTAFTEQRFHYFLSGEHRTREWNKRITKKSYLVGHAAGVSAHTARTYGILFNWELTGDPDVGDTLQNYMHAICSPKGVDISAPVQFPQGALYGSPGDIHGRSMFFHNFGGGHALLEYYNITGDERVRNAMIATADYSLREGRSDGPLRKMVAFAASVSANPALYRSALENWISGSVGWRYAFQQVPYNRDHWTGETSFLVGNVPFALFWLNDVAIVMAGMESEPHPTSEQKASMLDYEKQRITRVRKPPRESWQSEYDHPDFENYISEKKVGIRNGMP